MAKYTINTSYLIFDSNLYIGIVMPLDLSEIVNDSLVLKHDDVLVLGEDRQDVITYSVSKSMSLYGYSNKKYTSLKIPYTTIKPSKLVRSYGVREMVYEVFHRPDKSPLLRSMLDLWGFNTYTDYLYTICELGFLEGLVPVIDFGFLTPDELTQLYEVVALAKTPLFNEYDLLMDADKIRKRVRSYEIKTKVFQWATRLNIPVATGFFLYQGLDEKQVDDYIACIADIAANNDCVHEVVISLHSRTADLSITPATEKKMITCYEKCRKKIPSHIPIFFPEAPLPVLSHLIKQGETDIGSFSTSFLFTEKGNAYWSELKTVVESQGKTLQQRFPLRHSFIKSQRYSKKLSQIFAAFSYKIKKEGIEKQKMGKL